MKFTEASLENAFTELLGQEGFPHHVGASLADARKPDEVLIKYLINSIVCQQETCIM